MIKNIKNKSKSLILCLIFAGGGLFCLLLCYLTCKVGFTKDLNATSTVALPNIHEGKQGWTCTGLAYDPASNTFLVGDIGKDLPSSNGFASQIIRVSIDFTTIIEEIPLYTEFSDMLDIQGITIDTSDGTVWFCSPSENLIRHIDKSGVSIGCFSVKQPTGVSYCPVSDSLWVLTSEGTNNIKRMSKSGSTIEQYTFQYDDKPDHCFFDYKNDLLYITAGEDYQNRNNIYLFNTSTHIQTIAYTVDPFSVEGIYIDKNQMIIMNDGYYHSAAIAINQVNIYSLNRLK